jgi:hypothetical protein
MTNNGPIVSISAQNTIRSLISHMAAATGQGAGWRGCPDNVRYCAREQWNGADRAWTPSFVKGNLKFGGAPKASATKMCRMRYTSEDGSIKSPDWNPPSSRPPPHTHTPSTRLFTQSD